MTKLANSQNINDNLKINGNLKTYLKTKSCDHLLDVVRQHGSNSQIGLLA